MFTIATEKIGAFTHVKLINKDSGEYFSFLPDFGATLNRLCLKKRNKLFNLLDGSRNALELLGEGKRVFKGSKLFPFPNRIASGLYTFSGKSYQLPINFPSEGHAIHGLVLEKKFTIIEKKETPERAYVRLNYNCRGNEPGYPFPYHLSIKYEIRKTHEVSCETTVENTGTEDMPMGDGWHPYFQTGTKIDDLVLTLPATKYLKVDNHMIPTGEILSDVNFIKAKKIGSTNFDTCYKLEPKEGVAYIVLEDPIKGIALTVWQETGKEKYNYVQVYTPPSRKTIAIEPMTCAPDAFNNGMGLITLTPGQKWNATFGVRLG